jgi:hypothetical protein
VRVASDIARSNHLQLGGSLPGLFVCNCQLRGGNLTLIYNHIARLQAQDPLPFTSSTRRGRHSGISSVYVGFCAGFVDVEFWFTFSGVEQSRSNTLSSWCAFG